MSVIRMALELGIDQKTTALVVIDLQKGIAGRPTQPHEAKVVIDNASKLAKAFRQKGMQVILVHVNSRGPERLSPPTDETWAGPANMPADWADLVPELGQSPEDIIINKKQWGAFYGTELELQLRRRGIKTIVLCGISTNYGVESTARNAYEMGFHQVFAEDALTSHTKEAHEASVNLVLKRMGLVSSTSQILAALG